MNTKSITLVTNGTLHDLTIAPSTTTADVRRQLDLPQEFLISKRDGLPFGEDEDIWSQTQSGDKLWATPPAVVGYGIHGK